MSLNNTDLVNVSARLEMFIYISDYFVIPINAGISGSLNFFIVAILMTLKSELNTFSYLKYKSLNDMILCILIGSMRDCLCIHNFKYEYDTLFNHIYRVYFLNILFGILTNVSIIMEIGLTYDRLMLVRNIKNRFTKMPTLLY